MKLERTILGSLILTLALAAVSCGETTATTKPAGGDAEALPLQLPKPRFEGTPANLPGGIKIEKEKIGKIREPFMAPKGVKNVAAGAKVTSSDPAPILGGLDQITDGDKEAADGSFVELQSGTQWVQIDLGDNKEISAIVLWHRHNDVRIYRDVIVQVSDDPDFINGVKTLFNNDFDNSSGLGVGTDYEYIDDYQGKLVDAKGAKARYVRLYSKGSTADEQNHWTEVEVWGK